jgi:hypothetical protein
MNTTTNQFCFSSKDCKAGDHYKCAGFWIGLGLDVKCDCSCHGTAEILEP